MMDRKTMLTWSSLATLVGGLLVVVGAVAGAWMMGFAWGWGGMMPHMAEAGWSGPSPGWWVAMAWWMTAWGILSGGLVLAASWRIRADPASASTWGIVAIVGGALSLLAMGGYFVGAALSIVGGVLAVAARDAPAAPRIGAG